MHEIAKNVFQISLYPRHAINAYVIGTFLVDAGVRSSGSYILKALGDRKLTAHVLTHAHPDHQGASAFLCRTLNLPFWCGERDKVAAETGSVTADFPNPKHPMMWLFRRFWAGPGYPVARILREGDMLEEFQVLETPGHSPGHLAFWRESDRTLIAGDVITNMSFLTTIPGVHEPRVLLTKDIAQNRQSIKKIAALEPKVVGVGHGPPLYDTKELINLAKHLN